MKIINTEGRQVYDLGNLVVEPTGRSFRSRLPNVATAITLVSGAAYFVYVGRSSQPMLVKYVEFYVNTAGSPSSIAQAGLFTTPSPPNKATTQTVTKLIATADVDIVVTLGLKRSDTLNYVVPAGTYLWAGIRTALTTTQPAIAGVCMDFSEGLVLSTLNAGDLSTTPGPWTGSIPGLGAYLNSAFAPDLRITLD